MVNMPQVVHLLNALASLSTICLLLLVPETPLVVVSLIFVHIAAYWYVVGGLVDEILMYQHFIMHRERNAPPERKDPPDPPDVGAA